MENDSGSTEAGTSVSDDKPSEETATVNISALGNEEKEIEEPTEKPVESSDEVPNVPDGASCVQVGETTVSAVSNVVDVEKKDLGNEKTDEAESAQEPKAPEVVPNNEDGAESTASEVGNAITEEMSKVTETQSNDLMDSSDMEVVGTVEEKTAVVSSETEAEVDMDVDKDAAETGESLSNDKTTTEVTPIDSDADKQPLSEQNRNTQMDAAKDEEAKNDVPESMEVVEKAKDDESLENVQCDNKSEAKTEECKASVSVKDEEALEKTGEAVAEEALLEEEKVIAHQDIDTKEKGDVDDDIILIDDDKSTAEDESKEQKQSDQEEPFGKKEQSTKKPSTEEKEGTEGSQHGEEQKSCVNTTEPKKEELIHPSEENPEECSNAKEDDDVVMIDCESKSSETSQIVEEKPEEATKEPVKEENDDVMVIESDDLPKESTSDETKTDESTADKDASVASSKDDTDDVMVVESQESVTTGDSKTEDEKVDSLETNVAADEKSTETDKPKDTTDESCAKDSPTPAEPKQPKATKRYVLDEKSGMFEEKETAPEETVPQVFGDSDEDVVMVDNYVTTDRKSAAKPVVQSPTLATAANQTEQKPTGTGPVPAAQKKEVVKPKSSSSNVECINMECKKESRETTPAPGFILNFFGIPKKTKKQRICVNCYDEVVEKYSVLGGAVLDQQPLLFCEMPQKNELVEISDSSEEEEDEDVKQESEKPLSSDIISLVESELNDILTSTFEKININQQIDWTEQIMKQKIAYNSKLSDEINNELNELQRKVDRIHLQLYSKSRPRYQDLPPCNIFEVDPQTRQSMVQQTTTGSRQYTTQRSLNQSVQQSIQPQPKPIAPMPAAQSAPLSSVSTAPQKDEFSRPAVNVGQFYFAVKHKLLSNWAECQVVEAVSVADKALYKVNFLYNQGAGAAPIKVVPAKYLAYRHSFNVKLPLGTRVIARFDAGTTQPASKQSQQIKNSSFYPGIIAESFGKYNRNRYLIFFDDGYAQYVTHGDVRVVCEESKEVWTDIHPHSQEFIKNYLMNYRSQRPMVQVKVGQRIITEWKGKWIYAKVIDIDASLVQLHFADDNRYEWIYRGSTRLGPLYQEKALSMSKANNKFSKFQKRNEPSIEYITLDDDEEDDQSKQQEARKSNTLQEQAIQNFKNLQLSQADSANRSVAKKSTFHRATPVSQPSAVFMNSSTIYCEDDRPKGKIVYYTAKKHLPPLKYKPHECNPSCLFKITHNLKSYSPMAKPLLSGWERQLCKMKYKKVFVVYRAPCGRRVRNMYELHMYLRMTKATLNVENFDFDPMIHCLAEYVIENHIYHNPDLSDGREFMAVPCVNYFDDTKPPPCIYSTERIPTEGVNLNLDSDFLCGCDCEDDCIDKSRCQCWQLTIAGAKFGNPNTQIDNIGYVYKRLQEPVVTGIYECNSRCRCKSNCLNRVVQHPLMTKLQVFKTSNRGWGIRCLNDVAKGSFICIYSGHLLTEEAGNNICQANANKAGDEYFADLDYIETVEQLKEGYEEDVVESESEVESDYDARQDSGASDDDFTASTNPSDAAVKTRSQARRDSRQKNDNKSEKKNAKKKEDTKTGSDDEREMVNLIPNSDMTKGDAPSPAIKYRSVRKLFGKHEQIYIMDAKKSGNLGRYFNHSCNPNLFVQNVFVDTHDLRFPWVAFFALCNVRAGSELTWNYNYDVGSVPGKVLYCQCGAENCRQRLL